MDDVPVVRDFNAEQLLSIVENEYGELGGGVHTAVRLACDSAYQWVAIKCFPVTGGARSKMYIQKKIKREAELLLSAKSPYVGVVLGWTKWPRSMGLVMEYLPGGNLHDLVVNHSIDLPPRVILQFLLEIATGVAAIHNLPAVKPLIHGDLKPQNVVLSKELQCKVVDFGGAELMSVTGATTMTGGRIRKTLTTLAYSPPEKLRNPNAESKKEHDVYSLGMITYTMLMRKPPYLQACDESAFIELILKGERPDTSPITELKSTLSADDANIVTLLEELMNQCWCQEPLDRPSMTDARNRLQHLKNQQDPQRIQSDLTKIAQQLSVFIPCQEEHRCLPLSLFSPMNGVFFSSEGSGIVVNTYNIPNVQQAAIGCTGHVVFGAMPDVPAEGTRGRFVSGSIGGGSSSSSLGLSSQMSSPPPDGASASSPGESNDTSEAVFKPSD